MPATYRNLALKVLWLGTMMVDDRRPTSRNDRLGTRRRQTASAMSTTRASPSGSRRLIAGDHRWVLATKLANPRACPTPGHLATGCTAAWRLATTSTSTTCTATTRATPMEETITTMARLIQAGQGAHWGLSNFRAWRLARHGRTLRGRCRCRNRLRCSRPTAPSRAASSSNCCPPARTTAWVPSTYSPLARGVLIPASTRPKPCPTAVNGSRASAHPDKRLMQTEWRPRVAGASAQAFASFHAAHAAIKRLAPGHRLGRCATA